jgi:hypothetical protein
VICEVFLKTQNMVGGFGPDLNSTGCADIDSIDPLVRLFPQSGSIMPEIRHAAERVYEWVLANFNEDGSAVFQRLTGTTFLSANMQEQVDEGSAYATWWRTLSLAYLGQILTDKEIGKYPWNFVKCPGHQFLDNKNGA